MNKEAPYASFESGPTMRSREEALVWVQEQLARVFDAAVIAEGVKESGQVEIRGELHDVDFSKEPECAPVAGIQLVLGKLEDLLDQARGEGIMPYEEKYLGLCIDYLHGVEHETHSAADMVALEPKVPGITGLVDVLDGVRTDVVGLRERAANNDLFRQSDVA